MPRVINPVSAVRRFLYRSNSWWEFGKTGMDLALVHVLFSFYVCLLFVMIIFLLGLFGFVSQKPWELPVWSCSSFFSGSGRCSAGVKCGLCGAWCSTGGDRPFITRTARHDLAPYYLVKPTASPPTPYGHRLPPNTQTKHFPSRNYTSRGKMPPFLDPPQCTEKNSVSKTPLCLLLGESLSLSLPTLSVE